MECSYHFPEGRLPSSFTKNVKLPNVRGNLDRLQGGVGPISGNRGGKKRKIWVEER